MGSSLTAGTSLLSIKLTDVVEAVAGSFLLCRHSVFVSGSSPHGNVQFDERLVVAGRWVDDCVVFRGSRTG